MVDFKKLREKRMKIRELKYPDLTDYELKILSVVGYTEATTFFELCNGLRSPENNICPEKGDKPAWATLFRFIDDLESEDYLVVQRDGRRTESLQLTDKGADAVRDWADNKRSIIVLSEDEQSTEETFDRDYFNLDKKDGIPF